MKKIILGVVVLVLAAAVLLAYFAMQGPDLTAYEHLKEPAISTRPPQKMIVVEAKGDPNIVGKRAFELLFDLYYDADGVTPWPRPAPRARWPVSPGQPRAEWTGVYGLPVPDSVTDLPIHVAVPGLRASLTTWAYGDVVELLYVGPYDEETPTLKRLAAFALDKGYVVTSPHEEEYLKGPGMFFRGNPDNYVTILRYEVRPVVDGPAADEAAVDQGATDEASADEGSTEEDAVDEAIVDE
ncbi:MAG: hypothetical protein OXG98_17165 [Gemmatimonadetes bacterium]|nr:hypothetical protein [Gemmatimonadota bacterium]